MILLVCSLVVNNNILLITSQAIIHPCLSHSHTVCALSNSAKFLVYFLQYMLKALFTFLYGVSINVGSARNSSSEIGKCLPCESAFRTHCLSGLPSLGTAILFDMKCNRKNVLCFLLKLVVKVSMTCEYMNNCWPFVFNWLKDRFRKECLWFDGHQVDEPAANVWKCLDFGWLVLYTIRKINQGAAFLRGFFFFRKN